LPARSLAGRDWHRPAKVILRLGLPGWKLPESFPSLAQPERRLRLNADDARLLLRLATSSKTVAPHSKFKQRPRNTREYLFQLFHLDLAISFVLKWRVTVAGSLLRLTFVRRPIRPLYIRLHFYHSQR